MRLEAMGSSFLSYVVHATRHNLIDPAHVHLTICEIRLLSLALSLLSSSFSVPCLYMTAQSFELGLRKGRRSLPDRRSCNHGTLTTNPV